MGLTLILPEFTPDACLGLNGVRRTHWRALGRARDAAKWHLIQALGSVDFQAWPRAPRFEHARVMIVLVYPQRRQRDADNLTALCKPLLDGLVDSGVLVADDTDHVTLRVGAVVEAHRRETRIQIESLNEEWNP